MKIDDINKVAKRHMVYIWPEIGVFVTPGKVGTWWDLNPHCSGGLRLPSYALQPYTYAIQKGIWSIFGRKKVYFLIPTSEKVGTW